MFKRIIMLTVFMFLCIATYAEATRIVEDENVMDEKTITFNDVETITFNEEYVETPPQERIVAIQLLLASFDIWRNSGGVWTDITGDGKADEMDRPVEYDGPDVFRIGLEPSVWCFSAPLLEDYILTRAVVRAGPVSRTDYNEVYSI